MVVDRGNGDGMAELWNPSTPPMAAVTPLSPFAGLMSDLQVMAGPVKCRAGEVEPTSPDGGDVASTWML
jgi:hypothetical protein